jgi:Zn-dependent M16 (insulinase) family peptidase
VKEIGHPSSFKRYSATLPNMTGTHFKKSVQFKTDYSSSVITKYESQRTGMSAVVVDREGPKVLGYFALATEILDDSGAPHTLEHLCFMGSKNYRFKGVLDRMASRYELWNELLS